MLKSDTVLTNSAQKNAYNSSVNNSADSNANNSATGSSSDLAFSAFQIQDLGIIVVNQQRKVCLWNNWLAKYSQIQQEVALGKGLCEVFAELDSSRLLMAIDDAIDNGMSAILSQIFNKFPLPLYLDASFREKKHRIHQKINIRPLHLSGESYAMIEVKNVTASVTKEKLFKQQAKDLRELNDQNTFQRQHLQNILNSSTDAILTLTADSVILDSNHAAKMLFDVKQDDFHSRHINEFIPEFAIKTIEKASNQQVFSGIGANDKALCLEIQINSLADNELVYVVTIRDITERQKMKDAIFRSERLARTALESIADGVITTDRSGIIDLVNPIAASLLGKRQLQLIGQSIEKVFVLLDANNQFMQDHLVLRSIEQGVTVYGMDNTTLKTHSDKTNLPVMVTASPIFDAYNQVTGSVLVFRDVQESRRLSSKLSWEASHDTLTGLSNRKAFNDRLEFVIKQSLDCILLFLDLDRFKLINDTAGHAVGDELLKQVGDIFIKHFRKDDFVSRLGGDEFAVLLVGCPLERARNLAKEVCLLLEQHPFPWQDRVFTIGVSIGLTIVQEDDNSPSKVIERADAACYSAKQSGRSRVHVYGESDAETEYQANIYRASEISEAIAKERFVLYKQPIVSIAGEVRKLHHYEILIRMLSDDGTLIPPNDFIPAAEQFGLMQFIDRYVITNIIKYIQKNEHQKATFSFAINLSGASIIDEIFLEFLDDIIHSENIRPEQLHFEITETVAISNLSRALVFIEHFKKLGFSFALDDFGSGMSSFGYLKNLPLDYIKIDGQFVKEIVGNETDFAMVSSINYLGHMMGLKCIAEFVENDEILEVLDRIGVDFAQGYGIEKPTPLFDDE